MIKRLAGCIRQYKRDTILTPLFMLGEVSCECIIPLLTADLINNIQAGCSMNVILGYGLKLFLVAMLSLACGAASGWFCASSSAGFARNLRKDLYYKVQDFSFSNIDRFSTSSLVTRLTTDVANVQQAFMMLTRMAVRAPMMLIFASIMSIRVGKQLAFIFAGIIPVLGFCLYLMAKTAMPLFKAVQKGLDFLSFPSAALGGQGIDSAPHACGDGTVYGGTHKAEDVVDGLPGQHFSRRCFGFRLFGGLFGLCIPSRRFQKLRLEAGKQIRSQIGNRQSVDFGLEVGAILAVVLVNVLPFASAPGKVGVHYLPDGNFVALNGIDAGGIKLGKELCPLLSDRGRGTPLLCLPTVFQWPLPS